VDDMLKNSSKAASVGSNPFCTLILLKAFVVKGNISRLEIHRPGLPVPLYPEDNVILVFCSPNWSPCSAIFVA